DINTIYAASEFQSVAMDFPRPFIWFPVQFRATLLLGDSTLTELQETLGTAVRRAWGDNATLAPQESPAPGLHVFVAANEQHSAIVTIGDKPRECESLLITSEERHYLESHTRWLTLEVMANWGWREQSNGIFRATTDALRDELVAVHLGGALLPPDEGLATDVDWVQFIEKTSPDRWIVLEGVDTEPELMVESSADRESRLQAREKRYLRYAEQKRELEKVLRTAPSNPNVNVVVRLNGAYTHEYLELRVERAAVPPEPNVLPRWLIVSPVQTSRMFPQITTGTTWLIPRSSVYLPTSDSFPD
ncbi:MAG: hypothetical protein KDA60_01075, partial [Planctomycetales bacterium]|nr:hypothetical protein [Planctomycetales bacterium]